MTLQELLDDIWRQSSRIMSREVTQALVDEASAHLDASVQARMDLGASLADAESQAVVAFGDPRTFVESIVARGNRRRVFRKLAGGSLFIVGLSLMLGVKATGGSAFDGWFEWTIYFALLCAIWTGLTFPVNLKSKFFKSFLLSIPLAALVLSFAIIGTPNPLNAQLRWYIGSPIDVPAMRGADEVRFHDLKSRVLKDLDSRPGPYQIPILWYYDRITYKQAETKKQALKMLNEVERKMEDRWDGSATAGQQYAKETERLRSTPFLLNIFYLLPLAAVGVTLFSGMLLSGYAIGRLVRNLIVARVSQRQDRGLA